MILEETNKFNQKTLIRIAFVISFIQFVNALEYMVYNPIFSFMAKDFSVPVSFSGYASGIYTLGAVISGFVGFYFIDNFNKKRFLIFNMLLLGLFTFLTTCITSFNLLLVLRFCAGLVGGTTMGFGTSILINNAPPDLRGKMLAIVIAAFAIVNIFGMPTLLYLCTHYGWHESLWLISSLCLLALPFVMSTVPNDSLSSKKFSRQRINYDTLLFASGNGLVQFSPMLIMPILVPLLTLQFGVSQNQLPWIFFCGGIAGYFSTKLTGKLISHINILSLSLIATIIFTISLLLPLLKYQACILFMILFIGSAYSRLILSSAVAINFPKENQIAGFSSLQTSIMYIMTTIAFFLSSSLLPSNELTSDGLNKLLIICISSSLILPTLVFIFNKKLINGKC